MPALKNTITGTLTANGNSANSFRMPRAGVLVGQLTRTAGTMTVALEVKIPGSSTFVQAYNSAGTAITYDLSSSLPNAQIELLAMPEGEYRLVASNNSSGSVDYALGLCGEEVR